MTRLHRCMPTSTLARNLNIGGESIVSECDIGVSAVPGGVSDPGAEAKKRKY